MTRLPSIVQILLIGVLSLFLFYAGAVAAEKQIPPEIISVETSSFEEYAKDKNFEIKQFGYGLFRDPISFAPVENIPVGPDYMLGPGDELKVSIWGKLNADYTFHIDREGKIVFPQVGVLNLSGLTFAGARAFLEKELSRLYLPSEVKMNLSMGALRTIRVFVVGKARRPGSYTISSLSTLINSLFAAGGPDKTGSMRDIQLKRGGATVVRLDLYDFLLKGDKSKDVRLQPEDVIFIPPVGPLAGISGHVKTPAIYELKGAMTAGGLIELSGGLSDIAFTGRLQIERIYNNERGAVFETSISELASGDIAIQAGDLLKIFPVVQDRRVVRLSGAVQRQGEFGVGNGLTIKELIELAGGLRYYAYTEEAELTRVRPTPEGPKTEKKLIRLKRALEGDANHNIDLKDDDYLFIRAVPEWELYRTVKITGEVRFPGTYTIEKGETLSSLIERAGGYTDKAYLKGAVFTRTSVKALQQQHLDESIERLEKQLLTETAQTIESALTPEEALQQKTSMDYITALIAKMKAARAKGRITIRLSEAGKLRGSPSDLVLEEGDVISIPETPSQVQVIGAVYNQSAFVYSQSMSVTKYLKKAGGMTRDADDDEIYVLKVDGSAVSAHASGGFWSVRWDSDENGWTGGSFMSSRLDPGDTIVVPEKVEKVFWLREAKDITQILYQIAVTAGVLIVAF